MAKSMTGFGRGSSTAADYSVTVEISTVNRKQFDATLWLPREWMIFEVPLQKLLKERILRGAVKCTVSVQQLSGGTLSDHISQRLTAITQLAEQLGLSGKVTLSDLVTLSTLEAEEPTLPPPDDTHWEPVRIAATQALDHLEAMRQLEGEKITLDIRTRLQTLHRLYTEICTIAPTLPAQHRDILAKRIQELLPNGIVLNDDLLAKEVALFADRCDISEELTRLDTHFVHAEKLLSGEEPCGRALDFLCQEFFREINTTGSKCASDRISEVVIQFKTLLETVREQVQNLE